jgi:hypothetical protein
MNQSQWIFILGSPRSGTTLLGEILAGHPSIAYWPEPYFVWDYHFRNAAHDERSQQDASLRVADQIRRDFTNYRRKKSRDILVEKSPRSSLKIPFIHRIFPEARFIHILRDGRDATLSIHKQWQRRRQTAADPDKNGNFNYTRAFRLLPEFTAHQPYLTDKLKALWFETHGRLWDRNKHLNRMRWNGEIGWGPRFKGWQDVYQKYTLLQFNAYQWLYCVRHIRRHWLSLADEHRLEIRYEELIQRPRQTLGRVLNFLGLQGDDRFFQKLPEFRQNNFNKWQTAFDAKALKQILPILELQLIESGYLSE